METIAELTLGLGDVHPGTGTQHKISPQCNSQPGFVLARGMSHLVLLGHLSLGSWPGAGCKITIDLSAGAPVWFGNDSVTMNSLILPSTGLVYITLHYKHYSGGWETKGSLLVLMAAVGSAASSTCMRQRFLSSSKDWLKGG